MKPKAELASASSILSRGVMAIQPTLEQHDGGRQITQAVGIPVIGIGASPACDGQVLVTEDMLGLFSDYSPRFVKRYANLSPLISTACAQFAMEVRQGSFPTSAHCFTMLEQPQV